MRIYQPLLLAFLGSSAVLSGATTSVNLLYVDNWTLARPLKDSNNNPLEIRDVVQVGVFAGIDPDKDPATYTDADWAKFVPLTGNGSLNSGAPEFGFSIIGSGVPIGGFYNFTVTLDSTKHNGVPTVRQRLGVRIFDSDTVATATHYNTASASSTEWILPAAVSPPEFIVPAIASVGAADTAGTLAWEGTPFITDLIPGPPPVSLVLTGVNLVNPTTLQISWSGGDGSNNIQTSTNGVNFTNVLTGASSPALITVNPATVRKLLVRVVEP